ncbi:hypothetical protein ACFW95_23170 [Streptomyces sp. NPDC059474]|uniref:hypothetical protein n=1 Tax=Streptomyces sp. NPDC059474 TaxID=3346846 RepID=UPI0036D056FB
MSRIQLPSQKYELTEDGRELTRFSLGRGSTGARFTLHGADYLVRTHRFSGVCELLDAGGKTVATTGRVSRNWTLTCAEQTVTFRRTGAADREHTMIGYDGEPAGVIRLGGHLHTEATADLPGLELVLQVFALVAVLLRSRHKRVAAGVRATTLSGG